MDCSAHGIPAPRVSWHLLPQDELAHPQLFQGGGAAASGGTPLSLISIGHHSNLLSVLPHNNSLSFRAFSASDYDPKIHSATYQCKAVSESGVTLSRPVKVTAGKSYRKTVNLCNYLRIGKWIGFCIKMSPPCAENGRKGNQ